jgi:pimeloyl-ACP methyl ester carboxylesterase
VPILVDPAIPADLDGIRNARIAKAPAVFVIAEGDWVVPPKVQHLLFLNYSGEKRLVSLPEANHNTPLTSGELAAFREACDWLMFRGQTGRKSSGSR